MMHTAVRNRTVFLLSLLTLFLFPIPSLAQEPDQLLAKVMRNEIDVVKELINSGADINQQNDYGHTPLIIALNYGYDEMAELFLSAGADIHIRGTDGATALLAAASNSEKFVETLLSNGADISARLSNGTGVVTLCATGILMERVTLELAELLLEHGAEVDESPTSGATEGYTPLMMSARNNHEGLVHFLIEHGANVNAEAMDGSTPLSLATDEGHQAIVDILKAAGAK